MVDLVKIQSNNIRIRDTSNNILFDTDNKYIKTDPNGNINTAGYQRIPTLHGTGTSFSDKYDLGGFLVWPSVNSYTTGNKIGHIQSSTNQISRTYYLKVPPFSNIYTGYGGLPYLLTLGGGVNPYYYEPAALDSSEAATVATSTPLFLIPSGTNSFTQVGWFKWKAARSYSGWYIYGAGNVMFEYHYLPYMDNINIYDLNTCKRGGTLVIRNGKYWTTSFYESTDPEGGGTPTYSPFSDVGAPMYDPGPLFFVTNNPVTLDMTITP